MHGDRGPSLAPDSWNLWLRALKSAGLLDTHGSSSNVQPVSAEPIFSHAAAGPRALRTRGVPMEPPGSRHSELDKSALNTNAGDRQAPPRPKARAGISTQEV